MLARERADQVPVDPDLKSPSNDEIVAGGEYEVFPNARVGISYTYRNLVRTIEDMSNDEANTYFIGNPGEGIADTFPKAKRTYHAVTLNFTKSFADLWLAQVSYTWSSSAGTTTVSSGRRTTSSTRTSTRPSTSSRCC